MSTVPEALAIAIRHHQGGRLKAAEQLYRQILAIEPRHAQALHLLGVIASQLGRHETAVEYIGRAIGLKGDAADFHSNQAVAYRALHKLPEAAACLRRALELKPDSVMLHGCKAWTPANPRKAKKHRIARPGGSGSWGQRQRSIVNSRGKQARRGLGAILAAAAEKIFFPPIFSPRSAENSNRRRTPYAARVYVDTTLGNHPQEGELREHLDGGASPSPATVCGYSVHPNYTIVDMR